MSKLVSCINKREHFNPHERIINIGGSWGKVSLSTAIEQIEGKKESYHVRVGNADAAVIVATHNGRKYLKTTADTTTRDNLLYLNDCP